MNISMRKLLQKMEQEINYAKSSSSEAKVRERVQAIKTLCELVLEEPENTTKFKSEMVTPASVTYPVNQPNKLQVDDEANGDSLFDF
jgi:hypothetical protein